MGMVAEGREEEVGVQELQEFRSYRINGRFPPSVLPFLFNSRFGFFFLRAIAPLLLQLLNSCLSIFLFLLIPFLPASAEVAAPGQNDLAARLPRLSDGSEVSLITY